MSPRYHSHIKHMGAHTHIHTSLVDYFSRLAEKPFFVKFDLFEMTENKKKNTVLRTTKLKRTKIPSD